MVESLERRVLFAAPSDVLTKAIRQDLLNHLNTSSDDYLQTKLNNNQLGAFDGALLDYMKTRSGAEFFWNTEDVAGIKSFVNSNIATSSVVNNANSIVAHNFPNGATTAYDEYLGAGDINWSSTGDNAEFVHSLNRQDFWQELAQAHVFTDDSKYVTELISQLSSWSAQSPALADANNWASDDPPWQPLDVALRADNWVWTYQMVLGSSSWTADANTLFLHKLYQHGDFLRKVTPYALTSNRSLFEASGLLEIAHLVPEFDNAADWKTYGRNLLFGAMDGQINDDGGHVEASPGYAGQVVHSLLEMYWLDQKKGEASAWPGARVDKLENAAEAYVQLLSPDKKLSALSDTYRQTSDTFWLRPRLILNNTTDFPAVKPRLRDVWLFGTTTAGANLGAPLSPTMPNRGNSFSMPDSGYYVMRSGADVNARQVIFDSGPTGGIHGHRDLFNFELFGYGHTLISDPGLYQYGNSVRRNWAISSAAHNTVSVDASSQTALEGVGNPGIQTSGLSSVAGGYQITSMHRAYAGMTGSPVVSRSVWYDGDGVMVIVDWAESATSHTFAQSFLLPTTDVGSDLPAGWIRSNNAIGNVKISSVLQPGQAAHRQSQIPNTSTNVFVSDDPDAGVAKNATRFYIDQTGTFAGFVTLVSAYGGIDAPDITANLIGSITPSGTFKVRVKRDGADAELISFQPPALERSTGSDFRPAAPFAGANDVAYDAAGRLHLVYNDRNEKNLKYAVRETDGKWAVVQTIDDGFEAGGYPSLALDSNGNPAVAYFDGNGGDLKYARMISGAWNVEKVDTAGSTGLYPSLVMSRNDGPMIGYYKRTTGDLRLALQITGGWSISTIDGAGDVGRCTSMILDPNRPTASKIAIAYDDSNGGVKKFAIQQGAGWTITTVDNTTPTGGGYTSLAYEPYKDTDNVFHPVVSYYDSSNSALKIARQSAGVWAASTIVSQGVQGLYTSLIYDSANRANVFFFKKTNVTAYRAYKSGGTWKFTYLGTGGREIQTSRKTTGEIAFTNLDTDGLRVEVLPG